MSYGTVQGKQVNELTKHDLPTPSLLLDLDAFEDNIGRMSRHVRRSGINLRPHAKTHKCAEVAHRQLRAGAVGICAATIREAEALAAGGITGLLITSEMVGKERIERLIKLTRKLPDTISVVDNRTHARFLNEAAAASNITLNVLLDIDPGVHRTGIQPGGTALALAQEIIRLPNLNLKGIQAYSGTTAHVAGFETRRAHSLEALLPALKTVELIRKNGIELEIVSGGSTGTYNIDPLFEGMTELQSGSYVFMDAEYRGIGGRSGTLYDDFSTALTVLTTVVSRNHKTLATVDAGFKAFATDCQVKPVAKDVTGVSYQFAGDEHGMLELDAPSREIKLGDRLEFIVPHCDPTVNLYDQIHCIRGEKIEAVWSIARGYA